jgi:hypothetical protein
LRQRLDWYKPALIPNDNLYQIAHLEPKLYAHGDSFTSVELILLTILVLSRSEANHSEFNNWLVIGAHRLHMSLMIDDTLKRDHLDIVFEAVCRWINEGSASRIPEGRVMQFRVDEEANEKSALSSEERVGIRFASAAALNSQDATEKVRCLDELWRFSCETPDAPHLCND